VTVSKQQTVVIGYSRQDVLRILRIHSNQLGAWERLGLVTAGDNYTFQDLVQLRKLRDLRATRLSTASIRASVHAMRMVSGVANPLLEAGAVRNGGRLAFRLRGAMVDPIARQFVFDFDSPVPGRVAEVGDAAANHATREARLANLFLEAVQREEQGRLEEAISLYQEMLDVNDRHAPACINLGTLYYNRREYPQAERLYRMATIADPGYALAFFDLGNVLDELRRLPEAIEAYRQAIALVSCYADAHYNLALAYERTGAHRKALRHWTSYVKLDPVGPWAGHARAQARKILAREGLSIVHRSSPARGNILSKRATAPLQPGLLPRLPL
jgi:tetratricopeptide (TPR) repeat protein